MALCIFGVWSEEKNRYGIPTRTETHLFIATYITVMVLCGIGR